MIIIKMMNLTSLTANFRFDGNLVPVIGAPPSADVCRGLDFVSKQEKNKIERKIIFFKTNHFVEIQF